ncbi:hypothetical protein U3516DRAFT_749505 [Neocallimastix sp. 'constans']
MKIENIHHLRVATKKKITENFMKFLIEHSIRYLIKHHVNVNDNGSSENREKMKILKILRRLIDHADANGNENDSIVPLINVSIDKKNLFFEEVIKNIIEHGINPN